jgi:c-di-GMP-binding flagellar brake protein YcgR
MLTDLISIGDKLELKRIRVTTQEDDVDKLFKSQILDFSGEDTAIISMPIEKGRVIPLFVGDKYNIRFFTKKGLFQCKSIITERSNVNNIYTLTVQFISELEKYQRRQFYRLECVLDTSYTILSENEIDILDKIKNNEYEDDKEKLELQNTFDSIDKKWLNGTIVDISGGGARVVSEFCHEHGDWIHMKINFSSYGLRNTLIKALIITSEHMVNRQGFFEHRIEFKDLQKEERESIIKYIFEEERRRRKKEKG